MGQKIAHPSAIMAMIHDELFVGDAGILSEIPDQENGDEPQPVNVEVGQTVVDAVRRTGCSKDRL